MAELQTLARPYAEAVFELAEAGGQLDAWSQGLAALSAIVNNDDMAALMGNPMIDYERLADAISDIGRDDMNDGCRNLVRLLAENGRLLLAPAIAEQFEEHKAEAENRVEVQVRSAVEFGETQQNALTESLEKRLERKVRLSFVRDESVIGGAVIRAGDLVIDGSLRAQLERMRMALTQ